MALSATTIFEVNLGGSDTNGGGFDPTMGGTDYSQQTSPQVSVSNAVTNGTTTITSSTANFTSAMVGNLVYVSGGTGSITAGWYQVVTFTNSTTIVVDRSTGLTSGTGVTLHLGGALASPGQASGIMGTVGMTCYIKYNASAYVITTASYNVAGGCCQPPSSAFFVGYDTTRALYTPFQNRPTIQLQAGVSSATIFGNLNANYSLQSVILDANSQTSSACYNSSGEGFYVKVMNFSATGFLYNTQSLVCILCEATGALVGAANIFKAAAAFYCTSHDHLSTSPAFNLLSGAQFVCGCIAYGNAGQGFAIPGCYVLNCVAYNNSSHGFYFQNIQSPASSTLAVNCIAEANAAYGYDVNVGMGQMINCASYNNTSGRKNSASLWNADINPITGSGSFFTNAASHNFTLNNTAGAGALCRAAGFPSQISELSLTLNYMDVNAVQHQDTGGGPAGLPPEPIIIARGTPF